MRVYIVADTQRVINPAEEGFWPAINAVYDSPEGAIAFCKAEYRNVPESVEILIFEVNNPGFNHVGWLRLDGSVAENDLYENFAEALSERPDSAEVAPYADVYAQHPVVA